MRLGRRIFWIRGPREWFRKPPEDSQSPRTSKYTVRRGIMQRVLVRELASALQNEANFSDGGRAEWAQGLPAVSPVHFEELPSQMRLVFQELKSRLFRRKLPRFLKLRAGTRGPASDDLKLLGDVVPHGAAAPSPWIIACTKGNVVPRSIAVASGDKCDGDKHDGGELHEGSGLPKGSGPLEGRPNLGSSPEGRGRPTADRRELVERYVAGVVAWCERALEAGDEIELPRIVEMALSDATVGYAFGLCEEEIPIDDLCGEVLRTQLDRIAERLIRLPGLEWWSEGFDPAAYTWHEQVPASSTVRVERPGGAPAGSAGLAATGGAAEWASRAPTISGAAWFPSSEMEWPVLHSYRDLSASRFDRERWEDSVVDGRTCTEQWFGDDAGDCDVARLDRGALAAGDGSRIASIHAPEDWMRIVARFPARLTPDVKAGWQGDAEGQMYTVDWQAARREIDGVYVSVAGALRSSFASLALEDVLSVEGPSNIRDSAALEGRPALDGSTAPGGLAALKGSETVRDRENAAEGDSWGGDPQNRPLTMMTGWTPGSILWLNRPRVS